VPEPYDLKNAMKYGDFQFCGDVILPK